VSMLQKQTELRVICEVPDGLEAVEKAAELQPDLILLDIGLPKLNGIEAARRIRELSPKSKIIFVSQESSVDIVQEALSLGAQGYVVKTHAGKDLLAAVEGVLQGKICLSLGLSGRHFMGPTEAMAGENERTHVVQFYTDDNYWRDNVGEFLCATVSEGKSIVICATPPHVVAVRQSMQAHDIDVQQLEKLGRFITLDAADTLLKFMNFDVPDQGKFESLLGLVIRHAEAAAVTKKNSRVTIIGEMVALLWGAERVDATIKLEQLWNGLARTHSFHLRCAYPATGFQGELMDQAYTSICAQHSATMPV
jgi:CheY-like chemotaxis protein